jgi:hypothetical protein
LPFNDAVAATIISGAEEPIATMVNPMIIGDTPMFLATAEAPNTNLSAPQLNTTSQSRKKDASTITQFHFVFLIAAIVAKRIGFAYTQVTSKWLILRELKTFTQDK